VSPHGVIVIHNPNFMRIDAQIDHEGTIRGQYSGGGGYCVLKYVWQKAPASTTTFDGTYIGVSRGSSKTVNASGAECPPNAVPNSLTIANGVTVGWWQGTVNPQGVAVMWSPSFPHVDAQIDTQGTIKGQSSSIYCLITFVWQKQSK
jgi:hypothetical protein